MHLTSIVEGRLADDRDRLDALVSCFPAGTVSGAPKVRAMQIIRELEPSGRGLYAGAVGYLDFAGNLDFCIAIRTVDHLARTAPTCRPEPASSWIPIRRRNTKKRATRRKRCCGRSSWRRRDCEMQMSDFRCQISDRIADDS